MEMPPAMLDVAVRAFQVDKFHLEIVIDVVSQRENLLCPESTSGLHVAAALGFKTGAELANAHNLVG